MSQMLTIELSNEVYAAIQRQAAEAKTSPAHIIATSLEQAFGMEHHKRLDTQVRSEAELQTARERFERHFGTVDLGYATGADNEIIDADLARVYAEEHEDR